MRDSVGSGISSLLPHTPRNSVPAGTFSETTSSYRTRVTTDSPVPLTFDDDLHFISEDTECVQLGPVVRYHVLVHPRPAGILVEVLAGVGAEVYILSDSCSWNANKRVQVTACKGSLHLKVLPQLKQMCTCNLPHSCTPSSVDLPHTCTSSYVAYHLTVLIVL